MSRKDELFSEMIEKTKGAYAISIQGTFEYAFKAAIEEVRKEFYRRYENTDEKRSSEFYEDAPMGLLHFLDELQGGNDER
jgi:hypothetical protein